VTFRSTDSLEIHAHLYLPAGYDPARRYPAVAYFHGGPRSQQVLGYNYIQIDYYQKHYALNQYLANQGYIVLSVNYRGGTGYGLNYREAIGFGANGGSESQDVIGAGQYLRSRPDVDGGRIGVWGGSYGGYMTAMGLARGSDIFAAGVDVHGVHSFDARVQFSPYSSLSAAEREQVRVTARMSSPIGNVDTWRSPVLLIHGDDDRNVPFAQTVVLSSALRSRGVHVEHLVVPNEEHSFLRHSSWLRAFEGAAEFLDRMLKNRTLPAPSSRTLSPATP
jgi:dipeptidyl aminopeptidase/acylaminoacyl peptidase